MPKEVEKTGLFRTIDQYPPNRSNEEREVDFKEYMKLGQKLELDNMGKQFVTREVPDNNPKQILVLSDFHLGSVASDMDKMEELRDYVLSNPNIGVIFAGDEMEGMTDKYLSTIGSKTKIDAQQQVEFLKMMFFEPLKDQILGMVSEYWAHPGWIFDSTTLNTWRTMIGDMDIPLLQNGGQLIIKFPNGYEHPIKVWHNPPGASKDDELSGQRVIMQKTSESARPKGSVAGHIHRVAVAEESYAGSKYKVYYISAGTTKGSSPDVPRDSFGTRLGLGLAEPQGQGVTILPKNGEKNDINIPFVSLKHGKTTMDAVTLLNRVESLGMKEELLELIHDEKHGVEKAPKITYLSGPSSFGHRYKEEKPSSGQRIRGEILTNPYSHMRMKIPYSELSYKIETQLPIALHLIQNARIGSGSEGYKNLQGYLKNLADNPHALMVFMRNMIDKDAGRLPNRIEVLDKLVDLIDGNSEQTLAIMMCESMRQDSWKSVRDTGEMEKYVNEKGKTKFRRIYTSPIAPASYVATETNKPLIHHLSLLKLAIGPRRSAKTLYSGSLVDKLEGHGSGTRPEWGLSRLYDLHIQEKPGFVAGGHTKNAGAMMVYDESNAETKYPIFVAPGWWSSAVDSNGKGNVQEGAEPGQVIIFLPGKGPEDYMAITAGDAEKAKILHDATTLKIGLDILGLTDRVADNIRGKR